MSQAQVGNRSTKARSGVGKAWSGKNIRKRKPWKGKTGRSLSRKMGQPAQNIADRVVDLVNQARTSRGLPALISDGKLGRMAGLKSEDMRDLNYFSHISPTFGSPEQMLRCFGVSFTISGENIAWGQATPEQVVAAWMNSPGHRANILNPNFTRTGAGWASGGPRRILWTQLFIG